VDGAGHYLYCLRIFRTTQVPGERIGIWPRGRHFLLHHNRLDLAAHCCGRPIPIADRSFVVPLQGKTTQVAWADRFNYSKGGAIGMAEAIVGEAVPGPGVVTDDRQFGLGRRDDTGRRASYQNN
jgi:hypothetical protein